MIRRNGYAIQYGFDMVLVRLPVVPQKHCGLRVQIRQIKLIGTWSTVKTKVNFQVPSSTQNPKPYHSGYPKAIP